MINLSNIFENEGIDFFSKDKMSIDNYSFSEYQDINEDINSNEVFETRQSNNSFRKLRILKEDPEVLKYFLDGSRKVYTLGDFIINGKYLPIMAGQIATACCKRVQRKIKRHKFRRLNIVALPDDINERQFERIKDQLLDSINKSNLSLKSPLKNWEIVGYKPKGIHGQRQSRIEDKGTAKIQEVMLSNEVELIHEIAKSGLIQVDSMLAVDGSLQFERQRTKMNPLYFQNVISIAKSFDPHKKDMLRKKKKEIGAYLKDLPFGFRTPVFKIKKRHIYGTWYIRIRQSSHLKNPIDGIIKIEKLAVSDEVLRDGFDSDLIDNISSSILAERNPTCYGKDNRWPSHLYPIYLTEKLVKSSFISDTFFLNIFN